MSPLVLFGHKVKRFLFWRQKKEVRSTYGLESVPSQPRPDNTSPKKASHAAISPLPISSQLIIFTMTTPPSSPVGNLLCFNFDFEYPFIWMTYIKKVSWALQTDFHCLWHKHAKMGSCLCHVCGNSHVCAILPFFVPLPALCQSFFCFQIVSRSHCLHV